MGVLFWTVSILFVVVGGVFCALFYPWVFVYLYKFPSVLIQRHKDKKDKTLRLYGIIGYVGDVGSGKTLSMVRELNKLRKKYKDKIYIATNFGYVWQDFAFETFETLLETRDKPLVVAWDEVQNEFCSRDFQKFPITLLTLLTQNRKGNGVRILYTCQHLSHIDKIFRDMTSKVYFCHTWQGAFTFYYGTKTTNLKSDLERLDNRLVLGDFQAFVQDKATRNAYDSWQILQSARNRGYGDTTIIKENVKDAQAPLG